MKLEIPFYKQTTELNCGPAALRMVLAYLDKDPGMEILEERTGIKNDMGVSTIQIAKAAALLGYKTYFFSKHIYFNEENLKLEFYQKYYDVTQQSKRLIEEAKMVGVKIEERSLALKKLLGKIGENGVPIILLDWNVVNGKRDSGYQGHFVPIVGYDENNIYVHNHGFDKPTPFLSIKKEIFEEARKASGTDEDIVIIHRRK